MTLLIVSGLVVLAAVIGTAAYCIASKRAVDRAAPRARMRG